MQVIDVKVVLAVDPYPSCYVRLTKDGSNIWWQRWGGGALSLKESSGPWQYRPAPDSDVLLQNWSLTDWVLVFKDVPPWFLQQVCSEDLKGDGLINNANFDPIKWTMRWLKGCGNIEVGAADDTGTPDAAFDLTAQTYS
jgi:hypothetical protein